MSRQCAEAFAELGQDVYTVDTEDRRIKPIEALKRWSKSFASMVGARNKLSESYRLRERQTRLDRIRNAFARSKPHVVFVVRGNDIEAPLIQEMRTSGAKVVGWWIKDAQRIGRMYDEIGQYDRYYCIHRNLCRAGIEYLPAWSVDRDRYYATAVRQFKRDLAFVGIWSAKRQFYLESLVDMDMAIVGPGWRTRPLLSCPALTKRVVKDYLHGDELVRFYQESRIVVSINQWKADEASGTTLRVADVPACGAFLLTEYSPGLEEVLTPGQEVGTFDSPSELSLQVEYWLQHVDERERVAAAGLARINELPTPVDRVRKVLLDLEESLL